MRFKKLCIPAHLEVIFDDDYDFGDGREVVLVERTDRGCMYCPVEYSFEEWRTLTDLVRRVHTVKPMFDRHPDGMWVWSKPGKPPAVAFTRAEMKAIERDMIAGLLDLPTAEVTLS